MTTAFYRRLAAAFLVFTGLQCGSLERDNPVDPSGPREESRDTQTLTLVVPLPKTLASVIDSIVAKLTGPDMIPIVKELDHTPQGPATLTIGAISPGSGRTLRIEGYDLQGRLIMMGEVNNIDIVVGDTTRVTINLVLDPLFVPEEVGEGTEAEEGDTEGDGTPADEGTASKSPG